MDLFGETPAPASAASEKPNKPEAQPASASVGAAMMDMTAVAALGDDEGLQSPRAATECLGHDIIEHQLLELYNSGRMPHGLIFSGIKGIGKSTMAYRLAKFLFKHGMPADAGEVDMFGEAPVQPTNFDVDPIEPSSQRVISGGHPDFLSIEREYDSTKNVTKASVAVDDIRKVTPFLRMTAGENGWRVVIIDDADTMTRSSQNALLKILEEPPKNTILVLITHRLGALIPTIRSRARTINFQPLTDNHIEALLEQSEHSIPSDDMDNLIQMSEGSVGRALQFLEEGGLDTLSQINGIFQSYPNWNWSEIHVLSDYFARKGQEQGYESFSYLLRWICEQLCKAKGRGIQPTGQVFQTEALKTLLRNSSLEQLLNICENLEDHFNKVQRANLDKKQAVLRAFSLIAA